MASACPPDFFSDTSLKRYSIIFCFVKPVYFLSFPISAQRISRRSFLLQVCSLSVELSGHLDNSWMSSLLSSILSLRHLEGSRTNPEASENFGVSSGIRWQRNRNRKKPMTCQHLIQ